MKIGSGNRFFVLAQSPDPFQMITATESQKFPRVGSPEKLLRAEKPFKMKGILRKTADVRQNNRRISGFLPDCVYYGQELREAHTEIRFKPEKKEDIEHELSVFGVCRHRLVYLEVRMQSDRPGGRE